MNEWITDKYLKEKISSTARLATFEFKSIAAEGERIRSEIAYLKMHLAKAEALLKQIQNFIKEGEEEDV